MEHETEKKEDAHRTEEKQPEQKTITIKEITLWKIGVGVLIILLVAAVWTGGFGFKSEGGSQAQPSGGQQAQQPAAGEQRVKVSVDDDPALGSKDAKVTVIEFSDFQCPFCGRHFNQVHPQIKSKYIDTGKIKFVYRDLPLTSLGHAYAQKAAEAAECADEQGKFWQMHDILFEQQQTLSGLQKRVEKPEDAKQLVTVDARDGVAYFDIFDSVTKIKDLAKNANVDETKFNQCVDSGKYQKEVENDAKDASSLGVGGTPTFFIGNDKKGYVTLVGAQPYAAFQAAIDAEL